MKSEPASSRGVFFYTTVANDNIDRVTLEEAVSRLQFVSSKQQLLDVNGLNGKGNDMFVS